MSNFTWYWGNTNIIYLKIRGIFWNLFSKSNNYRILLLKSVSLLVRLHKSHCTSTRVWMDIIDKKNMEPGDQMTS